HEIRGSRQRNWQNRRDRGSRTDTRVCWTVRWVRFEHLRGTSLLQRRQSGRQLLWQIHLDALQIRLRRGLIRSQQFTRVDDLRIQARAVLPGSLARSGDLEVRFEQQAPTGPHLEGAGYSRGRARAAYSWCGCSPRSAGEAHRSTVSRVEHEPRPADHGVYGPQIGGNAVDHLRQWIGRDRDLRGERIYFDLRSDDLCLQSERSNH